MGVDMEVSDEEGNTLLLLVAGNPDIDVAMYVIMAFNCLPLLELANVLWLSIVYLYWNLLNVLWPTGFVANDNSSACDAINECLTPTMTTTTTTVCANGAY